ncbi:MAG: HAD family hydrolase [Clostridia bacterium]|nr:HAD family hydrolase [Clostridia bacterium]
MKNYKNHIFDLDGTIADSMGHWAKTMVSILDDAGVEYPADIIRRITPLGDVGIAKYYIELGIGGTEAEIIERMHKIALPKYRDLIPAKEGICDYIKGLKAEGCKLFVLTASPHILVDPCLKRLGIFDLFDRVYTCDDFGKSKSNTEIYHDLCNKENIDISETVFYDDNIIALKTGSDAGLATIGIYDPSSDGYIEEIKETVRKYIRSFKELL